MFRLKFKSIQSETFKLEPFTLLLEEGNKILLIGKNGAGKSMLLKSLVLKHQNATEILCLDDKAIEHEDIVYIGRLGFNGKLSVPNINKEMGLRTKKWHKETFYRLIDEFSIKVEDTIETASLGNQQKLALAIALAQHPKMILIDEAFEGIDDVSSFIIMNTIKEYIDAVNGVLFLATHRLAGIGEDFDHILHIDNGRIVVNEDIETFKVRVNALVNYPVDQNLSNLLKIYKDEFEKEVG